MFNRNTVKLLVLIAFCLPSILYADGTPPPGSIGSVAANITLSMDNLVKLLTAGSYMAGFGLTIASLFKFKAHKEVQSQVQLGTCITMLVVGVCLIFLPSILSTGGATIFGTNGTAGNTSGFTNFSTTGK